MPTNQTSKSTGSKLRVLESEVFELKKDLRRVLRCADLDDRDDLREIHAIRVKIRKAESALASIRVPDDAELFADEMESVA